MRFRILGGERRERMQAPEVVRTKRLEIVDANGVIRAVLTTTKNHPGLAFLNEDGVIMGLLATKGDGPGLLFLDVDGAMKPIQKPI